MGTRSIPERLWLDVLTASTFSSPIIAELVRIYMPPKASHAAFKIEEYTSDEQHSVSLESIQNSALPPLATIMVSILHELQTQGILAAENGRMIVTKADDRTSNAHTIGNG